MNISNLFDLSGKVAIVTGSENGIGKETAILLAKSGANIAIGDFNMEDKAMVLLFLQRLRPV